MEVEKQQQIGWNEERRGGEFDETSRRQFVPLAIPLLFKVNLSITSHAYQSE